MKEACLSLLGEGLYADNLTRLIDLCETHFDQYPVVCWVLIVIAHRLVNEYQGQAISTERYDTLMHVLQPRLLTLVELAEAPPTDFLAALSGVVRTFHGIT